MVEEYMAEEVVFKISAKWDELNKTLTSSSKAIDDWSKKNLGGFSSMAGSLGTLALRFSALVGPVVGAGAAIYGLAQKTANAGDELHDMSKRTGIAVESLSGLKHAAELSGTSLEGVAVGLKFLGRNMADAKNGTGEAKDAFNALGINVADSTGKLRSTEEVFLQLSDKFKRMEDGAGKTALAMQIFGRSGSDLIPLLNEGGDGIRKMTEEAKKLGLTFTTEGAAAADQFNDNMTKLKGNFNGLVQTIGNDLIPALNKLFDVMNPKESAFARLKKVEDAIKNLPKTGWDAKFIEERLAVLGKMREELLKELTHTSPGQIGDKKEQAPAVIAIDKEAKAREVVYVAGRAFYKETIDFLAAVDSAYAKQVGQLEEINTVWFAGREFQQETLDFLARADAEADRINNKKPASDKPETPITQATQDISSPPQVIGMVSEAIGISTAPVVAAMINLVQAIVNLPKMLTDFVKNFMQALYEFPDRLIELLDTVLSKLPIMISDIFAKLWKMFPKILESAFKGIINMLISTVYAMFAFIPGLKLNTGGADSGLGDNTKATNKLVDSIDSLNDSINKQLTDLLTGSDSPASAVERLQVAWEEVSKAKGIFAGASGEAKVEAGSALQDALKTYLDVAQEAYQRPSTEYQAIFDTTVADLKAIQAGLAGINTSQSEASLYSIEFDIGALGELFTQLFEGVITVLTEFPAMLWAEFEKLIDFWLTLPQKIVDAIKSALGLDGGGGGGSGPGGVDLTSWALNPIVAGNTVIANEIGQQIPDTGVSLIDNPTGELMGLLKNKKKPTGGGTSTPWMNPEGTLIEGIANQAGLDGAVVSALINPTGAVTEAVVNEISSWFHVGGMIRKAHTGLFVGSDLASYEVPIIAKVGEGILNDYNGMRAIGGEAGLNYANKTGKMMGGGTTIINKQSYSVSPQVTINTKGEVDTASLVRQIVRATEDSLRYGKMKQIVNA